MLTSIKVDMNKMPEATSTHPRVLVIGDLHANAFKLIYHLQREGVIEGLSEALYEQLRTAYEDIYFNHGNGGPKNTTRSTTQPTYNAFFTEINRQATQQFYEGVKALRFKKDACKIVLLGDDMADRGARDDLVMVLYQHMAESGLDFEIVYSNHTREMVRMTELLQALSPKTRSQTYHTLPSPIDWNQQIKSIRALGHDIARGIVDQDKFIETYETVMKPRLKALSYHHDPYDNSLILFSHAPIGIDTIKNIRASLKMEETDIITVEQLMACIDQINAHFQEAAENHALTALYEASDSPLYFSVWNRETAPERPERFNGVRLQFVYGHTNNLMSEHCFSLNSGLGIHTLKNRAGHIGQYTAFTHMPPNLLEANDNAAVESPTHKRRKIA